MSGKGRIQYSVSWQEVVRTLKVYLFDVPLMKILAIVFVVFLSLAAALVLAGQLGLLTGQPPADLGVRNGRLKPPSATPNSVSSQADLYPDHPQRLYANIAPLSFTGDAVQAMQKLASILKANEHTVLVTQQPDYLYARCSTPLMHFTDDVEFWLDRTAGVIQLRSASRLGHGDLGANRARIEKLRAQFLSQN
jgi:uncharacterized protein (DUF1499 family)